MPENSDAKNPDAGNSDVKRKLAVALFSNSKKSPSNKKSDKKSDRKLAKAQEKITDALKPLGGEFSSFLTPDASPGEQLAELEGLDVDLVLLAAPEWKPSAKAILDLLYGYENGARVTVARRPAAEADPWQKLASEVAWLYIFFGGKRKDPDSPLRLYDKEAFQHLLRVLSFAGFAGGETPPPYQLSAIEHYFGFRTLGVEVAGWSEKKPVALDFLHLIKEAQRIKSAIRQYRSAQNIQAKNMATI